jgi:hypothetical protein
MISEAAAKSHNLMPLQASKQCKDTSLWITASKRKTALSL